VLYNGYLLFTNRGSPKQYEIVIQPTSTVQSFFVTNSKQQTLQQQQTIQQQQQQRSYSTTNSKATTMARNQKIDPPSPDTSSNPDFDNDSASTNKKVNTTTAVAAAAAAAASSSRRAARADGTNSTRSTARINSKSTDSLRASVAIRTTPRPGNSTSSSNVVESNLSRSIDEKGIATGSARYARSV
jgi:hypothetical protein